MIPHTAADRARDVELVADSITNAIRLALPSIVRKEVELQLGMREPPANRAYKPKNLSPTASKGGR
jgi:hypothetical protein